ncbi:MULTISPECIES: DUF6082 family protein [unclassified Streptomyces]|uniref:DUF6082 family protein n=1 Tax=unclassified Streptomyces TaxID=2593676 RepID=UPI002DDC12A8|nr:DUF6082 family protein [Streptomyces sp. NBC_00243]WRZ19274.1 DUF6082 family protein [Streptomyces sp. NBC_00243]
MAHIPAWRTMVRACTWIFATLSVFSLVGVASVIVSGLLIDGVEEVNGDRRTAVERSSLGSYFDGVTAVFSGLALLLLVVTLFFQQRELRIQRQELALQRAELASSRNELRRSAEADLRGLHVQLTQMQMDDPSLAEVWNDYPDVPPNELRQHLFANLTFGHYLLAYTWGGHTDEEMLLYARNLVRSPAFNLYWTASRASKSLLPPNSDEGRLFRIFETAIAEANQPNSPPGAPGS